MSLQNEIDLAIKYINEITINAEEDPQNSGALKFSTTPPPKEISSQTYELICDCIEYYKRAVFMGEFELETMSDEEIKALSDKNEAKKKEGKKDAAPDKDAMITDFNKNLARYKSNLVEEVEKALGVNNKKTFTPFVQAILQHQKEAQK